MQSPPPPLGGSDSIDSTNLHPSTAENLRHTDIHPDQVFSSDELAVLRRRFASFNPNSNKTRALSTTQALKLFRDEFPSLSEWEIRQLFAHCDIDSDQHLALHEYLSACASHRLKVEELTQHDVERSFTILDSDGDGVLRADEVLALVEQAGQKSQTSTRLLKLAITEAAIATQRETQQHTRQYHRHKSDDRIVSIQQDDREISCEHFVATVRAVNRQLEQEIAVKMLHSFSLQDELDHVRDTLYGSNKSPLPPSQRGGLITRIEVLQIKLVILKKEVNRARSEIISESNSTLTTICEQLVATYENEQHVYGCLRNWVIYCGLTDATRLRRHMEHSGRKVHVLDTVLMEPPANIVQTSEYKRMMDLSLHHIPSHPDTSRHQDTHNKSHGNNGDTTTDSQNPTCRRPLLITPKIDRLYRFKRNAVLRKQFVYYTMAGNVTNLETMTRSNFAKFVKDCSLHDLVPLRDSDIDSIYASATAPHDTTAAFDPHQHQSWKQRRHQRSRMTFVRWLSACELIAKRLIPTTDDVDSDLSVDALNMFMKMHVVPRAKKIATQNLAPDASQNHVLKLLREHIWPLKQIFFHFGAQSLLEVDENVTLNLKEYLCFARAFCIIRAPTERDGEPYTAPPLSDGHAIRPISQPEVIREFYAAKLDNSCFSGTTRRDIIDLTFREFLRCVQRLALAMHAHNEETAISEGNGVISTHGDTQVVSIKQQASAYAVTSFAAIKTSEERQPISAPTPQHRRRGNMVGISSSAIKSCKMTSNTVVSNLLRASCVTTIPHCREHEAVTDCGPTIDGLSVSMNDDSTISTAIKEHSQKYCPLRLWSPTRILYGPFESTATLDLTPNKNSSNGNNADLVSPTRAKTPSSPRKSNFHNSPRNSPRPQQPWVASPPTRSPAEEVTARVSLLLPDSPRSLPVSPRRRPVRCGGEPIVRIVREPDQ